MAYRALQQTHPAPNKRVDKGTSLMQGIALIFFLLAYLSSVQPAFSQSPTDFDGDGLSDFLFRSGTTDAEWSGLGSESGDVDFEITFGLMTDIDTVGHWLDGASSNLGIVRADSENASIKWKVLGDDELIRERIFGKLGDTILSGGDFDGSGITDAAVVRAEGQEIRWQIKRDLFTRDVRTRSFLLGDLGGRAFFASPDGVKDWACVIASNGNGGSILKRRSLSSGRVRTAKFPGFLTTGLRPRPLPIQRPTGEDALAFVVADESDTTIHFYSLGGRRIRKVTFAGTGAVVIGEYNAEADGQEVVLQTSSKVFIYNPFSAVLTERTVLAGTPLDEIGAVLVPGTAD